MCNYQNQLQLVTLGFKRNSTHLWVSFTKCLFNLLSRSIHLYYKGLRSYFKEDVSTLVEGNSCQRNLKLVLEKCFCTVIVKGNKFKKLFTVSSSVSFVNTVGSCFQQLLLESYLLTQMQLLETFRILFDIFRKLPLGRFSPLKLTNNLDLCSAENFV